MRYILTLTLLNLTIFVNSQSWQKMPANYFLFPKYIKVTDTVRFTGEIYSPSLTGATTSGQNLTLSSTSHATKGKILFGTSAYDEVNNRLGVKINDPAYATELRVDGMGNTWNADRLIGLTNTTAATSVAKFQSSPGLLFRSNSWKNSDASYPGYFRIASMASSAGDGVNDLVFSYSRDGSSFSTGFKLSMPAGSGTPALISDIARFGGIQEWYFGISGNYIFDCYGDADATIQHYRSLLSDPGYAMTLAAGSKKNSATNAAGGELKLKSGASSGNASSYMTFWTATAGASGTDTRSATEKMRLLGNGYLGIGLTTPTSLLHLDAGTSTASALKLTANATTGQTATDGFDIGIDASGNGKIWNYENTYLSFATNNAEALRINADNSSAVLKSKYHYYRGTIGSDADGDFRMFFNTNFVIEKRISGSFVNYLSYDGYRLRLYNTVTGLTAVGDEAGNTTMTGQHNSLFGNETGNYISTGKYNSLFGMSSGRLMSTGSYNTGVGRSSLYNSAILTALTGSYNIGIGKAGGGITTGSYNVAIGEGAIFASLDREVVGSNNIAIGKEALRYADTASNTIAIGNYAGAVANVKKSNSLFIGNYAGYNQNADADSLFVIDMFNRGNEADEQDNSLFYGNFGEDYSKQVLHINARYVYLREFVKLFPADDPPATAEEGMIYSDTDHHIYYYNGTTWKQLDN